MPSRLYFEAGSGSLDPDEILAEAVPIAKLIGLFVGIALVPFVFAFLLGGGGIAVVFALLAQFVLAVGAAVVLLYLIVRGIHLAEA